MIPLQTTCEEYGFRGYLAQGIGSWMRNRWAVLIITSVAFGRCTAPNPEVKEYGYGIMMAQYITMGLILGVVTLLDDGIEVAMGIHAANNIFASVLLTFKGSVLPTAALFMAKETEPCDRLRVGCGGWCGGCRHSGPHLQVALRRDERAYRTSQFR